MATHIRFDWAMKRLLRNKANFDVLEGFLSVLLNEDVVIQEILEGEGNKVDAEDKYNRIDVLVKNSKDELILIEVQNERENDYFHRMNYGQAKLTTQYLYEGDAYGKIKKVYSINIVYFDLGQGIDYVYKGLTEFRGLHKGDLLALNPRQKEVYPVNHVSDIFATYYLLKVNTFNDVAKDSLDEWMYFLKHSEIKDEFTAKGLPEAKEKLRRDNLSPAEKHAYEKYLHYKRISENEYESALWEGRDLAAKEFETKLKASEQREAEERKQREEAQSKLTKAIRRMLSKGFTTAEIAEDLEITEAELKRLMAD